MFTHRQRAKQQNNPCVVERQSNPVSVVGGSASIGGGGVQTATPVNVGNQFNSQRFEQFWGWRPWWAYSSCVAPYPYAWPYPYATCSPWGWPNWGYQGAAWPYGWYGYGV